MKAKGAQEGDGEFAATEWRDRGLTRGVGRSVGRLLACLLACLASSEPIPHDGPPDAIYPLR